VIELLIGFISGAVISIALAWWWVKRSLVILLKNGAARQAK
jgi:hypothetical protein